LQFPGSPTLSDQGIHDAAKALIESSGQADQARLRRLASIVASLPTAPISKQSDRAAAKQHLAYVRGELARCATSLDQDKGMMEGGSFRDGRMGAILRFRIERKELLREAFALLEAYTSE